MTSMCYGPAWDKYFCDPHDRELVHLSGTKIKVKDSFIERKKYHNKSIWKYASFVCKKKCNNVVTLIFCKFDYNNDFNRDEFLKCDDYFHVEILDVNNVIEEYIKDFTYKIPMSDDDYKECYEIITKEKKHEITIASIILLIVMLASLIFNGFIILWIIELILFEVYRNGAINK